MPGGKSHCLLALYIISRMSSPSNAGGGEGGPSRATTNDNCTTDHQNNNNNGIDAGGVNNREKDTTNTAGRRGNDKTSTIDNLIGGVVNPFLLNVVDVDGIVRHIDINALLGRVDWDPILAKIDWNTAVLDRIDWNQQLSRIDLNSVVKRVSVDSIVAQSTTGIVSSILDEIRSHVVQADLILHMLVRCNSFHGSGEYRGRGVLPPAPGRRQRTDRQYYPHGRYNKSIAVQGRYCGFISKMFAILTDVITVTIIFSFVLILLKLSWQYFMGLSSESASEKVDQTENDWVIIAYCINWFLYFFLSMLLTGQTFGMAW